MIEEVAMVRLIKERSITISSQVEGQQPYLGGVRL